MSISPTFLLRHLSQALETLFRRGALRSGPSSIEEGCLERVYHAMQWRRGRRGVRRPLAIDLGEVYGAEDQLGEMEEVWEFEGSRD